PPDIHPLSLHDALPIWAWKRPGPWHPAFSCLPRSAWRRDDLVVAGGPAPAHALAAVGIDVVGADELRLAILEAVEQHHVRLAVLDRKSTRLNSSHVKIS